MRFVWITPCVVSVTQFVTVRLQLYSVIWRLKLWLAALSSHRDKKKSKKFEVQNGRRFVKAFVFRKQLLKVTSKRYRTNSGTATSSIPVGTKENVHFH